MLGLIHENPCFLKELYPSLIERLEAFGKNWRSVAYDVCITAWIQDDLTVSCDRLFIVSDFSEFQDALIYLIGSKDFTKLNAWVDKTKINIADDIDHILSNFENV